MGASSGLPERRHDAVNIVKSQSVRRLIEFVFGLRTGPESGRHYRGFIAAAGGGSFSCERRPSEPPVDEGGKVVS